MRTIKFRGKAKEFNSDKMFWAFGDLVRGNSFDPYSWPVDCAICADNDYWIVDPATVGQFTGLQDADGVDIYEGDLIKGSNGSINGVAWEWGPRVVAFKDGVFNVPLWGVKDKADSTHWFEVVGNIHDKEAQ